MSGGEKLRRPGAREDGARGAIEPPLPFVALFHRREWIVVVAVSRLNRIDVWNYVIDRAGGLTQ